MTDKTSKAVVLTARLNPINPTEEAALVILAKMKKKGFNFKQVAVDAILRAEGKTPEMFAQSGGGADAASVVQAMEGILHTFAEQLLGELRRGGFTAPSAAPEGGEDKLSAFARNFVTGFSQRSQSTDEDPTYVDIDEEF